MLIHLQSYFLVTVIIGYSIIELIITWLKRTINGAGYVIF